MYDDARINENFFFKDTLLLGFANMTLLRRITVFLTDISSSRNTCSSSSQNHRNSLDEK